MKFGLRQKILIWFLCIIATFGILVFVIIHFKLTDLVVQNMEEKLSISSELGYAFLESSYPGDWEIKDGKLFKGETLINENYTVVDKIREKTNVRVTIFMNDTRVSTNVKKVDGNRAINTKVADNVKDIVLIQGKEYQGEATVVDQICESKYVPLKNSSGKIVGIWFVGVEKSYINNQLKKLDYTVGAVILVMLIIGAIIIALFSSKITQNINVILKSLKSISGGNLCEQVSVKSNDEIGDIALNLNITVDKIKSLVINIKELGKSVLGSIKNISQSTSESSKVSMQVANAITSLAEGASEQAATVEKSSTQIKNIISGLEGITNSMNCLETFAGQARDSIISGETAVKKQELKMNETVKVTSNINESISSLSQNSREIGQILEVIRGISSQTNLLALNAAIEAARAGEQGRGFAVVAEEIRKLAEQSSSSVTKIGEMIEDIQSTISRSVEDTNAAKVAITEQKISSEEIVQAFSKITALVSAIADNINNVFSETVRLNTTAASEIDTINSIAALAESTAASSEEISASSEEQNAISVEISSLCEDLSKLADSLNEKISKFNS